MDVHIPLKIEPDTVFDRVTIEGITYAGDFFRNLGPKGFPQGTVVTIENREDGVVTLKRVDLKRIHIGPLKIRCAHCKQVDDLVLDLEVPNLTPKENPNGRP
jgi:hypothetical protein